MKKTLFTVLVAVVLISYLIWVFIGRHEQVLINQVYDSTEAELSSQVSALSLAINRKVSLLQGFTSFVGTEGDNLQEARFNAFLDDLLKSSRGILNTAVYSQGVVTFVYPREGNESVLGYRVLEDTDPQIRAAVLRTLASGMVSISGPQQLIQGGTGLVARQAILREGHEPLLVGMVLDLGQLYTDADFFNDRGAVIALRKMGGEVFYGSPDLFEGRHIELHLQLPDGSWEAAAKPRDDDLQTVKNSMWLLRAVSYSLLLLIAYSVCRLIGVKRRLQQEVCLRTTDLQKANEEISQAYKQLSNAEGELRQQYGLLEQRSDALQESEQKLFHLAYSDGLTGIANRAKLQRHLEEAVEKRKQYDGAVDTALVLFDLDSFKTVNDSFGHLVGDELLKSIARRIEESEISYHLFARMGGDEFVILLQAVGGVEMVKPEVEKLLSLFQAPVWLDGFEFYVTPSIGVVLFSEGEERADLLLKNADIAMYKAKAEGGNRYRFYEASMAVNSVEKLKLASGLRHALERNEFELFYQPQVDSLTGTIVGIEALIRWRHPERGLVPPGEFIPIAEETGLIVPMTEWVIREACGRNKAWQDAGFPKIKVAVNLPASLFYQPQVEELLLGILSETGLEPQWLDLEITETVLVKDEYLGILMSLLQHGMSISIDDFGTHYSALSYLKRFPISKIKIDKSFIDGIHRDDKDEAIISAMILVSRQLQLDVVAEGVETAEQVRFLQEIGCSHIQGYHYYRPMPTKELERIFQAQTVQVMNKQRLE
ncbi:bifunctional diguanylate cyclase/phosphodiesterase [Paenibacillus sp. y28]|uniref:bifunctional diguanylate cyclase/phosphodiesterase n=1 Tax=Paenibacillus sp. y28 TaxID=3129110 RepID=UPI00301A4F62